MDHANSLITTASGSITGSDTAIGSYTIDTTVPYTHSIPQGQILVSTGYGTAEWQNLAFSIDRFDRLAQRVQELEKSIETLTTAITEIRHQLQMLVHLRATS